MNTYFTRLIDYRNHLSGSAEKITEVSCVTDHVAQILKECATTINIFERDGPYHTCEPSMDAVQLVAEKAIFWSEIMEFSTGAAR
jgi:hypothetical protein